ncbi:MAG: hypothetical protein ACE5HT_06575 [Gemmatimonadales bacterium]
MSRATFIALGASLALLACSESTAPPIESFVPQFDIAGGGGTLHILTQADSAPRLETLQASIWVVRGEKRRIRIRYEADPNVVDPEALVLDFVELEFDKATLESLPNGTPIADGDSVLVSLTVHSDSLLLTLEPTGLTFSAARPARLKFRYHNANPDLDGVNGVDPNDELIRTQLLNMWQQEDESGEWSPVAGVEHRLESRKFDAPLLHFSNYAIAW